MSPPAKPVSRAPLPPSASGRAVWWILAVVFLAAAAFMVMRRLHAAGQVRDDTAKLALASVHTVKPVAAATAGEVMFSGDVQPYVDTPIFARTTGYLKKWLVDIGEPVKEGQVLAEIESPEVDQQLAEAQASVAQVAANVALAQTTAERWRVLVENNAVSQQQLDEKNSDLEARKKSLEAAQANRARLQELKSFQTVTAPFAGTITQRKVAVGDLINNGGAGQQELFRLVQDNILRVYVSVPEVYSGRIATGEEARLDFVAYPGRKVTGTVVRTSGAISSQSRTMRVEVQVKNEDHALLSGGYATVYFPLKKEGISLSLPVNTLLFRPEGTLAAIVDAGGTVRLAKVRIGNDYGSRVEIIEGVQAGDEVILNPSDSLQDGSRVQVEKPAEPEKAP